MCVQKFGTVCMIGQVTNGKFIQDSNCKMGTVTVKSMQPLSDSQQYNKLVGKVKQNLNALRSQINYISRQPEQLRMFRITSSLLPLYDHPELGSLYDQPLLNLIKQSLTATGQVAKQSGVRLSMHPDQYVVINSDKPEVVEKSIKNLYMHKFILDCLDYGASDGAVINIHLNGKTDVIPSGISDLLPLLSFENDETKGTTERVLGVCEKHSIKMVLDLHHHWVNSGRYLERSDNTVERIIDTWQGVTPKLHLSQPKTLSDGFKGKRSHSDQITDKNLINYLLDWKDFDIVVEAKHKNVATEKLNGLL